MRLLVADKGQKQNCGRNHQQRKIGAAKQGVEEDDEQGKQEDRGPARAEGLLKKQQRLRKRAAHDQLDRKHKDGRHKQRQPDRFPKAQQMPAAPLRFSRPTCLKSFGRHRPGACNDFSQL